MTKNTKQAITLLAHYQGVRAQTLTLCEPLLPEDYTVQPHPDVSPPKWHLGHGSWFFENFILAKYIEGYTPFDDRLNWFFNSYYESQGPRISRSSRGNMTRPDLDTILDYRRHVDDQLAELLGGPHDPAIDELVTLGLHHEQQHQELLLTDIKYILGTNPLFPVYRERIVKELEEEGEDAGAEFSGEELSFLPVRGGTYYIGHDGPGFRWDNELSHHQVLLDKFGIANRLVTNGEYLVFMNDGGYERFDLWQMEGFEWVKANEVRAPLYWFRTDGGYAQYTLNHGMVEVDPNLPVTHVSWYEADAYARWAEARLPTEFEWEVACARYQKKIPAEGNWAERGDYHPTAATDGKDNQLLGHAWEWTNSAYLPYPRYPRPEGALGEYNGKFMVNQMVLRGGSCATPVSHIRPTYRNFFQTDKRWQFTGIRLAKDL